MENTIFGKSDSSKFVSEVNQTQEQGCQVHQNVKDFQFTHLRLYHLQKTKKKRTKTEKCQIEFYFSSEFWSKIWVNLTIFDISQYSHANGHSEDTKLMTCFLFLIFYKNLTRGIGKFETIGNAYFHFFFYKIYRQDLCNFIK